MAFEVLGNGVLWRGDGETVRIEAWGRGIRVRAAVMAEIRDADFALLDDVPTAGVVRVDGNAATITASGTTVVAEEEVAYHWSAGFHRDRLRLRFQDADGRVVLEEIGDGGALMLRAREYRPSAFGGAALRARFASDPDEYHFVDQYTRFLDVTNPRARTWLWERLQESYGRHGIDLFWLDEAEPEYGAYEFDHYLYAAGPTAKVANIYPRDFVRAVGEGQRANGNDRPLSLVRAAWAGSQRHGALIWSGDVHSTWDDLRAQIAAGIHMGVAGIPWFTTDIGGFTGGWVDDPAFRELLVRWFQFGAFSPVMRLHGDRRPQQPVATAAGEYRLESGADNEVWSYGPEIEETFVSYIRLREALRPYTRALMAEAHEHGTPVMRGLFYEFPDDACCWQVGDQFLFGADVLVAPVLEPGATERDVYLPVGATWTDARTGEEFDGGQTVRAAAPLASIPVFARTPEALALLGELAGVAE